MATRKMDAWNVKSFPDTYSDYIVGQNIWEDLKGALLAGMTVGIYVRPTTYYRVMLPPLALFRRSSSRCVMSATEG
jgi:hypothetical protein